MSPTDTTPKLEDLDGVSRRNVIVQRMIEERLPFTRDTYIAIFYEGEVPEPWQYEHEARLPPVFRAPNAEEVRDALQNLGDAIGVTYSGTVPR